MARLKTTTLRDALAQCDRFTMEDYDAEVLRYTTMFKFPSQEVVVIERADESLFEFVLDSSSELHEGRAYFDDLDGEEHEFVFHVEHLLGER